MEYTLLGISKVETGRFILSYDLVPSFFEIIFEPMNLVDLEIYLWKYIQSLHSHLLFIR